VCYVYSQTLDGVEHKQSLVFKNIRITYIYSYLYSNLDRFQIFGRWGFAVSSAHRPTNKLK